nr:ABC transporter substrate-binding protein [Siccirubricoccus soli]
MDRRGLLGSLVALAAAGTARAAAPEQAELEFIGVRDPQLGAQLAVADQFGLFREEGIKVGFRWMQSSGDVLTVMGSGAPVGVGGPLAQLVLASQSMPVKIIAGLADISDTQGLALGPGVKVEQPRDLEGKKLAFTQGNSTVLLLPKLAELHAFDHTKVQLVNMNPSEAVVAASKGDVHGLLSWQPFLHRLVTMGGTLLATGGMLYLGGTPQVLPEKDKLILAHACILANQNWIDARPNTLAALLRALIKADGIIATDRPRAMQAMQRVLRIEPEPLQVMAMANRYRVDISDQLVAAYKFTSDWAAGIRRIPAPQRPEDGIASGILASVAADRVSWRPAA